MARSRNIKPAFFKNEDLAECSFESRLLFIGLWGLADKEGRLEDRPRRIKVEIFPYEEVNVDNLLDELEGFVMRYNINGCKYIQVLNFQKHQNPHCKEQASTIPAPDTSMTSTAVSLNPLTDSPLPNNDSLNDYGPSDLLSDFKSRKQQP